MQAARKTTRGTECHGTVTFTWTYTDCALNSHDWVYTYQVDDYTLPTVVPISDYTFDCGEDIIIPYPIVSDNCSDPADIDVYFSKTIFNVTTVYGPLPADAAEWLNYDPGTTTVVCVWAVDECGNRSIAPDECFDVKINPCGDPQCTYTQGYYGNYGGMTCDGTTTYDLVYSLLQPDGLVVGVGSNKLTFTNANANCIIDILPGGGPSKALNGSYTCLNMASLLKKGKVSNSLLAQTITLALNLRNNPDPESLGSMVMFDGHLRTAPSSDCDDPNAIVTGPYTDYQIPSAVINELKTNPNYTNTVQGLLDLANDALGGLVSNGLMSKITTAASIINEAFDECQFGYFVDPGLQSAPIDPTNDEITESMSDLINLRAFPNPFSDVTTIEFTVPMDIKVTLDIYTLQGALVENLYSGMAEKDRVHTYTFYADGKHNQATYIYIIRTAYGTKMGKLIMIK